MPAVQNSKQTLDFLETLGSNDRGDSVQLGNCAKALVELSAFLIETASDNLDRKGNTATGGTISSMKARDIQVNGTQFRQDIEIASTYKFLNDGVKGVKSGRGKYKFKRLRPGKKMVASIEKWIGVRSIASKYKAVSENERKNQGVKKAASEADNKRSLAYAFAYSIKKRGIKPTYFFTDAVKKTRALQKEKYAKAFKLDIIESLKSN